MIFYHWITFDWSGTLREAAKGEKEKRWGWIDSKSLPRFEGSWHFFNPCNSFWCGFVVWANLFESIIISNFYRFFKYIWNCHWIRKAKPKAATLALFLLISSDTLDLFIPTRKKKTLLILVSCICGNLHLFSNIHEKDCPAIVECRKQSIRLSINCRIYMWFSLSEMRCSASNMESPSKASNKSRYTVADIRLFQA